MLSRNKLILRAMLLINNLNKCIRNWLDIIKQSLFEYHFYLYLKVEWYRNKSRF